MNSSRFLLAPTAVASLMLGALGVGSAAGRSRAVNWETSGREIYCGVAKVYGTSIDPGTGAPADGSWPGLQCSAPGIPRPRQAVGDPFVQLGQGAAGRARLVDLSQDDLVSDRPSAHLTPGSTWERYGILCHIRVDVASCTNTEGRGFTLSPGHLRLR